MLPNDYSIPSSKRNVVVLARSKTKVVFSAQSKRKVLILDWLKSNVVLHASRKETQFASRTRAFCYYQVIFVQTRSGEARVRVSFVMSAKPLGNKNISGRCRRKVGDKDVGDPLLPCLPIACILLNCLLSTIFRRDEGAAYFIRFSRFFIFSGDKQPLMAAPKISGGF